MFTRTRIALGLTILLSLMFAAPAFAGGWAIITLDELPGTVTAGEPLKVGFMVRQHGQTPMKDLSPTVTARLSSGEKFVVNAEAEGKPGHYVATLTFSREGDWDWSIQAFTMDQKMPTLSVAVGSVVKPVSQPVVDSEPINQSVSMLLILRMAAAGIGLAGLVIAFRRNNRLAGAMAVLCLVVVAGSFATESTVPAVEAQSELPSESVDESSVSQAEVGRQLFIAKGCVTCHANEKATDDPTMTILHDAPDLTIFSASPESLRLRLKDPSAVNATTWMPDLDLSDNEVEALIAFINSR